MQSTQFSADEAAIRDLVESWARAVRTRDYEGILARHSEDILMFDLPWPLECRGLEAYRKTWDLFFSVQPDPIVFEIKRMDVVSGVDVAFVVAVMQCDEAGDDGKRSKFDFRLTIGLRKIETQWTVVHEHHSIPAT